MFLIIITPLVAGLIAQTIKFIIQTNKLKFSLKNSLSYSGMPSSHSALVCSLAIMIGLQEGFYSPLFGFAIIFALIIIRDALGLRRYLGYHSTIINRLIKDLKEDDLVDERYPRLLENIGHTPTQVVVGGLIGLLVSWLMFFFV